MGETRFKKVKMMRMKEMMRSLEPMRKSILSKLGSRETGLLMERQLLTEDSLKDRRGLSCTSITAGTSITRAVLALCTNFTNSKTEEIMTLCGFGYWP